MLKKWCGVMLLAAWLGQGSTASAQLGPPIIPMPVGATRLPDPMPCQPTQPLPQLVPGPISPHAAPPVPCEDLSLPDTQISAFQAEEFACHDHVYFHAGWLALQRARLGHRPYVYVDTTPRPPLANPEAGQLPATTQNIANVLDPGNIEPKFNSGFVGTLGYLGSNCAVELNGFYIPQASDEAAYVLPRRLNTYFTNPPPQLAGNNGLFLQGDLAVVELRSSLGGADLNYKYFEKNATGIEPLCGVRYVGLLERFSFLFHDEGITSINAVGLNDPSFAAVLSSRVSNHYAGPQFGVESQINLVPGIAIGSTLKTSVGANFVEASYVLARGDNAFVRESNRHTTNIASVNEANFWLDAYFLERLRMRLGYHLLYLCNFPEAVDQIDFDLSQRGGDNDNTGNILYHGWSLSVQLLF